MKQALAANRRLAELKGLVKSMPNGDILINTLSLQEAKDSSAIESIITTHDDLYSSDLGGGEKLSPATKEVRSYAQALYEGFERVKRTGALTANCMVAIYQSIKGNDARFRCTPGTSLRNESTKELIYTPPQSVEEIEAHISNLEQFINNEELSDLDPLVKMAVIHHQFESIHPFTDGNGRTGRIINILYLVLNELLDSPILYLSRYITRNKGDYYRLLQHVRETGAWEEWILYILKGIEETAIDTMQLIEKIDDVMLKFKHTLRKELPRIYSQDLINHLFCHPYTKISKLQEELGISRPTATSYLKQLAEGGWLHQKKVGNGHFYINTNLMITLLEAFADEAPCISTVQTY